MLIRLSLLAALLLWAWPTTSLPVLIALALLAVQNEAVAYGYREMRALLIGALDDMRDSTAAVDRATHMLEQSAHVHSWANLQGWAVSAFRSREQQH